MGGKAALVVVVGFSVLLGFVSRNLSNVATRAQGNMSTYTASTISHNLAVMGANVALSRLYQDTTWRGTQTQSLGGTLSGEFTYSVTNMPSGSPVVRSVSMVQAPDEVMQDTVVVLFGSTSYQSFTLFAWMTNIEGNIWWITGDTVWGRVHSNSTLNMTGSPTFMEKVTTTKGINPTWGTGGNTAVFKEGYETGVASLNFPTDLSQIANAATAGGRAYTGDVTVTLKGGTAADNDGYALVYKAGVLVDSIMMNDATFNGVIGSTGKVSISGTLDGKLSIFSTTSLYLTDDILYENRTSGSNDVLGLVAENSILIADNVPNATDMYIDASIFVRSGSYGAENYNTGSTRGNVYLNGSIVQNKRGAVGTFSGSTISTGYLKRYHYDLRLSDPLFRPPSYPGFYVTSYPVATWWESLHFPKFN
jgi:hypothetical protein